MTESQTCRLCETTKSLDDFAPSSYVRKDGTRRRLRDCRSCRSDYLRRHRQEHYDEYRLKEDAYYQEHREIIRTRRGAQREGRTIDLTGQTFGAWTVLELVGTARTLYGQNNGGSIWRCACRCGVVAEVKSSDLRKGRTRQCRACRHAERRQNADPRAPLRILLNEYLDGARSRGLSFDLSEDEFAMLVTQSCHYCGVEPTGLRRSRGGLTLTFNGVDRTDNSLGYSVANCVPCCKICNRAKMSMGYAEFRAWIRRLSAHHQEAPCI